MSLYEKLIKKEEWIDEIEVTNSFKQAVTIVTPIETGSYKGVPVTFAGIEIKTGRKHQILQNLLQQSDVILREVVCFF